MMSSNKVWIVARRELRSYFDHPTAYILAIAFLALALFLAFRGMYAEHAGTLRPLFELLPWLFAVFVPAITMRSFAEERRTRTLEWLLAQPLGEVDVVAGKFVGNWLFVLVALAGSLPTATAVYVVSRADPGIIVTQYLGAALLAAQAVAVGLWASSVTRNQITAFILGASVSFVLVLIGMPVVTVGLPPVASAVAVSLGVLSHFENVARGVVDLRDVLYFVTTALMFLGLAGFAVARARLSRRRGAYRRLRVATGSALAGVAVLNLLGGYVHGRVDLTRDGLYTLSPGTAALVHGLKDIVQVKLFVSEELPPEVQTQLRDVRDLLADLRRASNGNLEVIERNPVTDPDAEKEAFSYGIGPTDFNVLRNDEFQVKRGWFGVSVSYGAEQRAITSVSQTEDLEFRLASFIAAVTKAAKPRVAFLTGYGTRNLFAFQLVQEALHQRFAVSSLSLLDEEPALTPDSLSVVILPAPTVPMDSAGLRRLNGYLDRGGSALIMVENINAEEDGKVGRPVDGGLGPFLAARGVTLLPGVVFDMRMHSGAQFPGQGNARLIRGYPLWPVAERAHDHVTTRNVQNLSLGWPAPLAVIDSVHVQPIWRTSAAGGVRPAGSAITPDAFDAAAPTNLHSQVVAVAIDPGLGAATRAPSSPGAAGARRRGRLIVVGDADFLTDQFMQSSRQNLIFAANALDWLSEDESLLRIRAKNRMPPLLAFSSEARATAVRWGNLIGVPLAFALFGAVRIGGRARRARRRWTPPSGAAMP